MPIDLRLVCFCVGRGGGVVHSWAYCVLPGEGFYLPVPSGECMVYFSGTQRLRKTY